MKFSINIAVKMEMEKIEQKERHRRLIEIEQKEEKNRREIGGWGCKYCAQFTLLTAQSNSNI